MKASVTALVMFILFMDFSKVASVWDLRNVNVPPSHIPYFLRKKAGKMGLCSNGACQVNISLKKLPNWVWCTCDEDLTVWVTSLWPTIAYSSDVIAIRYTSNFKSDVQSILHGRYSIGNFSHLSDIKPKPCSFWVFCCCCLHFPAMQAVPLILFEVPLSSIWNDNLFSRNSCRAEFH